MRRLIILTLAIVLFTVTAGGAITYNLAQDGSHLPGETLFPLQVLSERMWGLGFNNDPVSRVEIWLGVLERRIANMEDVRGTDGEETAVHYFQQAYTETLYAIDALPEEAQPTYNAYLAQLLDNGLAVLESLDIMQPPQPEEVATLHAHIQQYLHRGSEMPVVVNSGNGSHAIGIGVTAAITNTNALDDPHNIPFPPGANMAEVHSFFPLVGGHGSLLCSNCHTGNGYKGVPSACIACHQEDDVHEGDNGTNCSTCHNITSWQDVNFDHSTITTQDCVECHTPPENHFPGLCSNCHINTSDWLFLNFDHTVIGTQDCANCHTRPANHYQGACTLCHSDTDNWQNAIFNHSVIGTTDCSSCHTPPANHFSGACNACHSDTSNWRNASFDHSVIGTTDCSSCHTPPANHFSGACSACHRDTGNWRNASFDHSGIGSTDCSSCHNPPSNHFSGSCRSCHTNTGNWHNVSFSHAGLTDCQSCHTRPSNHAAGQCSNCHNTSNWGDASFSHDSIGDTDCSSCHNPPSNHFPGSCRNCHTNTGNWHSVNFSHAGLTDCQSCH
ncbi:MAG: hypothetical protein KC415_12495, partial [Anaerolineales bacterium]|nr:hypothetical protein [Anaerolineales bacterium]